MKVNLRYSSQEIIIKKASYRNQYLLEVGESFSVLGGSYTVTKETLFTQEAEVKSTSTKKRRRINFQSAPIRNMRLTSVTLPLGNVDEPER